MAENEFDINQPYSKISRVLASMYTNININQICMGIIWNVNLNLDTGFYMCNHCTYWWIWIRKIMSCENKHPFASLWNYVNLILWKKRWTLDPYPLKVAIFIFSLPQHKFNFKLDLFCRLFYIYIKKESCCDIMGFCSRYCQIIRCLFNKFKLTSFYHYYWWSSLIILCLENC